MSQENNQSQKGERSHFPATHVPSKKPSSLEKIPISEETLPDSHLHHPRAKGTPLFGSTAHKHLNYNTSKVADVDEHDKNAVARRYIFAKDQFEIFKKSLTYKKFEHFIFEINSSVKGKKINDEIQISQFCKEILVVLSTLQEWTQKFPPHKIQGRYGNPAFREWFDHVLENAKSLMEKMLPSSLSSYAEELAIYLHNGLGNRTRIDYGSGHEASFVMWLCCLAELELIGPQDWACVGLRIFPKYLDLARTLQNVYMLEPAGSRGVHGLDDFQFLLFYWGSSQMIGNPHGLKPNSIHDSKLLTQFADDYMYFKGIQCILAVKHGPFAEHSSILNSISLVPHQLWEKVNSGLWRMYHDEVLNKFVVMQHFVFGTILPFEDDQHKKPTSKESKNE